MSQQKDSDKDEPDAGRGWTPEDYPDFDNTEEDMEHADAGTFCEACGWDHAVGPAEDDPAGWSRQYP